MYDIHTLGNGDFCLSVAICPIVTINYSCVYTVYCFCFVVKKFHGLTSFISFPEKLSQLPVTLPILGTLDSNIHGKTFAVTKQSAKTAKIFTAKQKQYTVLSYEFTQKQNHYRIA